MRFESENRSQVFSPQTQFFFANSVYSKDKERLKFNSLLEALWQRLKPIKLLLTNHTVEYLKDHYN